ncbi:hypothetical protein CEUSTIGMA_g9522.t1 [Chlamydomonas eustigma]|uniref:RRM domain-containing protein n=1 Tax=Chlamydomonas eustigma TaxID=1157962 RepID=A0A250XG85_9CHLO|nr:hypothetical protein CEUSTIGMA_g9522.t1 [Chlamydomonas eustigma]|eukprot:GAX82094.1 hypothetical protein CEUSTIGMA_g9522.t1 [Chlamydomonas eustigma]
MAKIPAGAARKAAKRAKKAAQAQAINAVETASQDGKQVIEVKTHRKRPKRVDEEEEHVHNNGSLVAESEEAQDGAPPKKKQKSSSSGKSAGAAKVDQVSDEKESPSQHRQRPQTFSNEGHTATHGNKPSNAASGGKPNSAQASPPTFPEDGVYELFVRYLPRDCDEEEATRLFSPCGELAKPISLLRDFNTGAPKGACFVTFQTAEGASNGLKLNGKALRGRHLEVTVAVCRRERPGLRGQQQAIGTHTPALYHEILQLLVGPDPDGVFVDATFGRGGHSQGILSALSTSGRLHGLDMDPHAVEVGEKLAGSDSRFSIHATAFSDMRKVLPKELRGRLSGVLFDLGISSPQLDDPTRGMRPEQSGPLDLRFDISTGEPAWRLLETLSREDLAAILAKYGDGQDSASAARVADAVAIAKLSGVGVPQSTAAFAALVSACRVGGDYQRMHAAKLTFQALRMAVNGERRQMMNGLRAAFKLLRPGGIIAVITWKHSEAALVTEFLRENELAPESYPLRQWWEAGRQAPAVGEEAEAAVARPRPPLPKGLGLRRAPAVCPSEAELRENSRSRSAVLHILHKEEGIRVDDVHKAVYEELGWDPLNVAPLHAI